MVRQVYKVIRHYFPDIFFKMQEIADHRKRRDYSVAELITAGIAMSLFKQSSRNSFNLQRDNDQFNNNYFKIFKMRLPHMDTVNTFLDSLPDNELEGLKATLMAALIEQRVLHKFKLFGKYFMVPVDGSGIHSYTEDNDEQSRTHKTSKNQVTTFYDYVLEAKLVTSSGLALSLATEAVSNETDRNFDKQDCEQAAFTRLAVKLKKYFPRLPICILVDGLYATQTMMKICKDNNWAYIAVLKDDCLKNLQTDIVDTEDKYRFSKEWDKAESKGQKHIHHKYEWISGTPLSHSGHTVHWLSCTETIKHYDKHKNYKSTDTPTRFVYLTSEPVNADNVRDLVKAGRTRWKIENEGFNTQKNNEYYLEHKFCRNSFTAYKNYYQCLQIAHAINQLVEHSSNIADLLNEHAKMTVKHLWQDFLAYVKILEISESVLELENNFQIRLAG